MATAPPKARARLAQCWRNLWQPTERNVIDVAREGDEPELVAGLPRRFTMMTLEEAQHCFRTGEVLIRPLGLRGLGVAWTGLEAHPAWREEAERARAAAA